MRKKNRNDLWFALGMLAAFGVWTSAIQCIDIQTIGPQKSAVGLATINRCVHTLTGVHMPLYTMTDWLGLIPLVFVIAFALLGLMQWIQRKHLFNVDYSILVLGGFYIIVLAIYLLFERFVVNYRPVLIDGFLEASYPSSTTMLVMCVMPTAVMQLNTRIKNEVLKKWMTAILTTFVVFMVICRLLSGVHWFTDIVGGALLSTGLVLLYRAILGLKA